MLAQTLPQNNEIETESSQSSIDCTANTLTEKRQADPKKQIRSKKE